jgi:hypothetical protein
MQRAPPAARLPCPAAPVRMASNLIRTAPSSSEKAHASQGVCCRASLVLKLIRVSQPHSVAGTVRTRASELEPPVHVRACGQMQTCPNTQPGGWRQQPAAALVTRQRQRRGPEGPLWVRRRLVQHSAPRPLPPLHSLQGRYTVPSQLTGAVRGGDSGAAAAWCLLSSRRHCRSLCSAAGQRDGCA